MRLTWFMDKSETDDADQGHWGGCHMLSLGQKLNSKQMKR